MLTANQIALIKASVPFLEEHGLELTTHFYRRMLEGNPELKSVFNQAHQMKGEQQMSLAVAVLAYAKNIENPSVLAGAVRRIAQKHCTIGIRPEQYAIVGRHLIASLGELLGEAATPELVDAWTAAYQQLADLLIATEQKIYDLVVRRFISVFYPAAEFDVTTRTTTVGEDRFVTEGKVLVTPGWMEVAGRGGKTQSDLCPVTDGESVRTTDINAKQDATRPPARYTDATLLSAMEAAGKKLETGELRNAMAEKGLGTPATRAQTIEGLIEQKYLRRDGRDLIPNAKAFQLMQLVRGLHIDELTQPKLTAEWERKLAQIESGVVSRDDFMDEIRRMTETIVSAAKQYEGDSVPIVNPIHFRNRCPACGGEIVENYKRFACTGEGCGFSLPKHPSGRAFEPEEVEELLATHHVGPLSGFISKRGFPFEGEVILAKDPETGEWGMRFDFEDRPEVTEEEIAAAPQIATCPLCQGRVIEFGDYYVCEHALAGDKKRCVMRSGKVILQRPISCAEIVALCETKRTPLLEGFVSKRTNRPFSAYLVLDKTKGVMFEFEKREKTSKTAKSADGEAVTENEASEEVSKTTAKRTKASGTTKTATKKTATRTRKTATAKKKAEPTEA